VRRGGGGRHLLGAWPCGGRGGRKREAFEPWQGLRVQCCGEDEACRSRTAGGTVGGGGGEGV